MGTVLWLVVFSMETLIVASTSSTHQTTKTQLFTQTTVLLTTLQMVYIPILTTVLHTFSVILAKPPTCPAQLVCPLITSSYYVTITGTITVEETCLLENKLAKQIIIIIISSSSSSS